MKIAAITFKCLTDMPGSIRYQCPRIMQMTTDPRASADRKKSSVKTSLPIPWETRFHARFLPDHGSQGQRGQEEIERENESPKGLRYRRTLQTRGQEHERD